MYGGVRVVTAPDEESFETAMPPPASSSSSSSSLSPASKLAYLLAAFDPEQHKNFAMRLSLGTNLAILVAKAVAFAVSGSLSVLAALMDSVLDVLSQVVLFYAEKKSRQSSAALYPAGASRFEPVGIVICAALMGMGSFQVIKEALMSFFAFGIEHTIPVIEGGVLPPLSMGAVIGVKFLLYMYCKWTCGLLRSVNSSEGVAALEALYLDHWNDVASNGVAVVALCLARVSRAMWFFDPLGALGISFYILYRWYFTGKEEIEKIAGKAADKEMIARLIEIGERHHAAMTVDVCRCYHFGQKFLVELEVVLPGDMILKETHDIGMDLQYKIENLPEVERAFVHIDYAKRGYDEHECSRKFNSYQEQISHDLSSERPHNL